MQTKCDECNGTGEVGTYSYLDAYEGGTVTTTRCPWCGGSGKVEVSYVVTGHGHNGDYPFAETWDVVDTVEQAKAVAEKAFARRGEHVLADGTPTLQWMEVTGPGIEESLGLDEKGWDGEYTPVVPA